ncbi:MAG: hypothetical protein WAW37_02930 [Syntrophobacteraceae bacterium]
MKVPSRVRTGELVPFRIQVSGGPVDNNEVTVAFEFAVTGAKGSKSGATGYVSPEVKGKIKNGMVVVSLRFRDPGNRANATCKIKYMSAGKEKVTKAVSISAFEVER